MAIRLLDCTLRDGGYLNDWDFGEDCIHYIVQRHILSGTEMVEVGFLDERRSEDMNRTIQPDVTCYDRLLKGIDKRQTLLFAMIDYGTCSIEHVPPRTENTMIDGIRVIFKKPNKEAAIAFAQQIKERGYLVTLQLVSITAYEDRDILDFCDGVNVLNPYAVSIVDTYGLMHQEQMMHYFDLLNHNLNHEIALGYHAHNNFQLAYSNTLRFLENRVERDVLVDGTALGMGKNAGNAPLELIMMYLNESFGKHYIVDQVLETIDACVLPIYAKVEWGYKLRFFLSASNACHPNYVTWLLSKKSLPIADVNQILNSIPQEQKLDYNKSLIEELYGRFQEETKASVFQDDQFAQQLENKQILLLGPGKSLLDHEAEIQDFIARNKPVVIAVNCIPQAFDVDYVFLSNSKRYSLLHSHIECLRNAKVVVTSNVGVLEVPDCTLDVTRYLEGDSFCSDNALALLLNITVKAHVKELDLAGFDGFSMNNDENFYDRHLALADDFAHLLSINDALRKRIAIASEKISIVFLTPSRYQKQA